MLSVVWWTCLLFAGAGARIYERCELARELQQLGVESEHIATWVCIAFHESRFDTAARNPHSGDHGLLQISELYWCGSGKVCGLPCSALRDDDISDDVECARRVYEEHTRLQGDGFLAWVVYPLHCKHSTKKYLVDCSGHIKSSVTVKPIAKSRAINTVNLKTNITYVLNPVIDELKPPYLWMTQNSGQHKNELHEETHKQNVNNKWANHYISDIDDLSLPLFSQKEKKEPHSEITKISVTMPTSESSRMIGLNEFKNRVSYESNDYQTTKPIISSPKTLQPTTSTKRYDVTKRLNSLATTNHQENPYISTTTRRPSTTTTRVYFNSRDRTLGSLLTRNVSSTATELSKQRYICGGCRDIPKNRASTALKPILNLKTHATVTPSLAANSPTTPSTLRNFPSYTNSPRIGKSFSNTRASIEEIVTTTSRSIPSRTSFWKTPTNTQLPVKIKAIPAIVTTTPRYYGSNFTKSLRNGYSLSSTQAHVKKQTLSTTDKNPVSHKSWVNPSSTTQASVEKTSSTQSVFDLYLNPTRPKLTTFKFKDYGNNWTRKKIFADGTTSPATPYKRHS